MRKDIIIIILSIGLFIISLLLFNTCSGGEQKPIEKIDTVYQVKYDTITVNRIINNNIYHYDTIIINDTVYIKDIPQTYKDSNENYSISINAVKLYDYDLDIYRQDSVVYIDKEIIKHQKYNFWKNRFYVGIGVGCQYGFIHQQFDVGVQLQVGIRLTK